MPGARPGPDPAGVDVRQHGPATLQEVSPSAGALLDAIEEFDFDACIGGARRDEEKARAKERIFSVRNDFGQWDAELWAGSDQNLLQNS